MPLTTPSTDVEAMLEGNKEVVQLQLRAGNISSGRPAGHGDLFNDIKRATAAGLNNHRNVVPVERKAAEEELYW